MKQWMATYTQGRKVVNSNFTHIFVVTWPFRPRRTLKLEEKNTYVLKPKNLPLFVIAVVAKNSYIFSSSRFLSLKLFGYNFWKCP